jgi:hypothetical protein
MSGVYPLARTEPGFHLIEFTPRGGGRTSASLYWNPETQTWLAFPHGRYDPDVLAASALAAAYVGPLVPGETPIVEDSAASAVAAFREAGTEGALRKAFQEQYSTIFNAPIEVQVQTLLVFVRRMLQLTEGDAS